MPNLSLIYSYFTLREWKIIHAALKHYFSSNRRMVDGDMASEDEIFEIRSKLPSASGEI